MTHTGAHEIDEVRCTDPVVDDKVECDLVGDEKLLHGREGHPHVVRVPVLVLGRAERPGVMRENNRRREQ